jgi:hypothetical protein
MPELSLYYEVVNATSEYLGPAADRFVSRQIRHHLQKEPEKLQRKDLKQLIVWIRLAMTMLSDDPKLVSGYIRDLEKLTLSTDKDHHGKKIRR